MLAMGTTVRGWFFYSIKPVSIQTVIAKPFRKSLSKKYFHGIMLKKQNGKG